jgi:2-aminoadipate transaminase
VDQEITNTLGELERKLHELERALTAMDRGEDPPEQTPGEDGAIPAQEPATIPHEPAIITEEPAAIAAEEPAGVSRLIDEAVEDGEAVKREEGAQSAISLTAKPQAGTLATGAPAAAAERMQPPSAGELLRFRDRLERTARDLTHDYDELLGRLSQPPVGAPTGPAISFARGAPSLDIVDVEGLRDAAVRAFETDPGGATAYGTSVGYPRLRAWIADRHGVEPERVLVTNGSMQADAFLFEQLVRPGDGVIVERPSYDRTLLSLRQRGARLHAIELQPDGIDTEALGRLLGSRAEATPKLAHIIPNFQNPAGYTLSLNKRGVLLELAASYGFLVFEDDPYVALRFSGESLPTMLSMDPGWVVYASSFSKTVCPGIRVGYLVGPPGLIADVAQLATNTYISPSMVSQAIVYEFCASGAIERSIETVRAALDERAATLADALRRELPDAEFVEPEGGYFMWVTLPEGTDVHALRAAAAERGVSFVEGRDFVLEGAGNALRLAYSGVTPEQIEEGVRRLAAAYRSLH